MEAQGLLAQASQDKLRRDQVLTQKARFEQARTARALLFVVVCGCSALFGR